MFYAHLKFRTSNLLYENDKIHETMSISGREDDVQSLLNDNSAIYDDWKKDEISNVAFTIT